MRQDSYFRNCFRRAEIIQWIIVLFRRLLFEHHRQFPTSYVKRATSATGATRLPAVHPPVQDIFQTSSGLRVRVVGLRVEWVVGAEEGMLDFRTRLTMARCWPCYCWTKSCTRFHRTTFRLERANSTVKDQTWCAWLLNPTQLGAMPAVRLLHKAVHTRVRGALAGVDESRAAVAAGVAAGEGQRRSLVHVLSTSRASLFLPARLFISGTDARAVVEAGVAAGEGRRRSLVHVLSKRQANLFWPARLFLAPTRVPL